MRTEHGIEGVTGHLSRRMLENYSHQRLKAKGQMLTRWRTREAASLMMQRFLSDDDAASLKGSRKRD